MKVDRIERILLVRLSALGDCVVAIPVFAALRNHFPHAHIAWAIQDNFYPLLRTLPGLDEIIVFPRQRWKQMRHGRRKIKEITRIYRHLRFRRFDLAVDVQSNTKSSTIAFFSRAPVRIGHGKPEAREISSILNNTRIQYPPDMKHILSKNLHLLSPLGIEQIDPQFPILQNPIATKRILTWLHQQGVKDKPYCLLVPYCGNKNKEWNMQNYAQVAQAVADADIPVIFSCAPTQMDQVKKSIPQREDSLIKMGPETDIPDLIELVRHATLCVGGDTGPLQLAGALQIPSISLFGPTDPARTVPWSKSKVFSLDIAPQQVTNSILQVIS